jgi:hypothetical protein
MPKLIYDGEEPLLMENGWCVIREIKEQKFIK